MRLHNTTLTNSIFRFDNEMIINTHVYGFQRVDAPSLHLRRLSTGDLFETYSESFESVWNLTKPATFQGGSMTRVDYYNNPNAPKANSIAVAVSAFIQDEGRILMIRRTDNDLYSIPGGQLELGETLAEVAVRKVREETGIACKVTGVIGLHSDPKHVIAYDDGEVRQEFSICFRATPTGGKLRTSSESREVSWVEPSNLADLNIHQSIRLQLWHAASTRAAPLLHLVRPQPRRRPMLRSRPSRRDTCVTTSPNTKLATSQLLPT